MLEHFHAGDDIPGPIGAALDLERQRKTDAWERAKPPPAFRDLRGIHVGADRLAEVRVRHGDERAVTAAVVEQASARVRVRERSRKCETAAVAPRDDAARAVDLLAGVIAVAKKVV
jgi:hypothetical protein